MYCDVWMGGCKHRWIPRFIPKLILKTLSVQFERDVPIWSNKQLLLKPTLVKVSVQAPCTLGSPFSFLIFCVLSLGGCRRMDVWCNFDAGTSSFMRPRTGVATGLTGSCDYTVLLPAESTERFHFFLFSVQFFPFFHTLPARILLGYSRSYVSRSKSKLDSFWKGKKRDKKSH